MRTCLVSTLGPLLAALSLGAGAASSTSSAVSDSASTSVGSVSTSFEASSDSSTSDDEVAAGEYRIIRLAAAPQRPDHMRLMLRAVAAPAAKDAVAEFFLVLPRQALQQGRLAEGQIVTVSQRPYGLAFARDEQAFFLVLHDDWFREMSTRPVAL